MTTSSYHADSVLARPVVAGLSNRPVRPGERESQLGPIPRIIQASAEQLVQLAHPVPHSLRVDM
jgi:hypothetical protein